MNPGNFVGPLGLQHPSESVRFTSLACLDVILAAHADTVVAASASIPDATASAGGPIPVRGDLSLSTSAEKLVYGLWVAMHDANEDNAAYADSLWTRSDLELKWVTPCCRVC